MWYVLLGWLSSRCHWLNQVYGLMESRSGNGQARHWMRETRLLNGSLTSSGNLAAWCALMKVPTINQEDAAIRSQPRKTMMKFRSAEALELNTTTTKYKGQPYLGQILVCEDQTNKGKIVSVGDIIDVEKMANTPLHVAASHNSVEVVKFLLNFARPETVDLEPKNRMIKMERNLLKPVVMKLQRFFSLTGLPPKAKKIME
ncbi:uncharacterized protein LOC110911067 isoform X1 [Helianthus annuus]|uniref:Putative ankyrin repeat-containing domain-containing protein n=2 Tax=Helianthus annuus TaxID=4232 RepID=A0A251S8E1_HELAN|nr:uncharacterized protein LOC110911067 isoform X1 [Helianthus annuus]XP_022011330.1 uncharacterized protein LOC110911067 isoform X1 [Helianthus annuus]